VGLIERVGRDDRPGSAGQLQSRRGLASYLSLFEHARITRAWLAGRPSGQGARRREAVESAGSAVCGASIPGIKSARPGDEEGVLGGGRFGRERGSGKQDLGTKLGTKWRIKLFYLLISITWLPSMADAMRGSSSASFFAKAG
jgi:hypothetical protein